MLKQTFVKININYINQNNYPYLIYFINLGLLWLGRNCLKSRHNGSTSRCLFNLIPETTVSSCGCFRDNALFHTVHRHVSIFLAAKLLLYVAIFTTISKMKSLQPLQHCFPESKEYLIQKELDHTLFLISCENTVLYF